MRARLVLLLTALLGSAAADAHGAAPDTVNLTCKTGSRAVHVTSEGTDLVYRYGVPGKPPELVLRGNAVNGLARFRHGGGMRSEYQQLRFVNGDYSYVLASLFVAPDLSGKDGVDRLRFLVLFKDKVIQSHLCLGAGAMEDNRLLDTLPKDRLPEIDAD